VEGLGHQRPRDVGVLAAPLDRRSFLSGLPGIRDRSVGVQPVLMKLVAELIGVPLGGHRRQQFECVGMSVVGTFYGRRFGSC
jgi:hypothetical protein